MDAFFRDVVLINEDLDKVEELWFDGGADIYQLIKPFWSGEDDDFDTRTVDGFEQLKNLKKVHHISMISEHEFSRFTGAGIECD
jgi:hypothetical protein